MGGIGNYHHGETGAVVDRWWQPLGLQLGDNLALHLELVDNPHRAVTRDYAGDIGIDPAITPGSRVVYLRLDDTCGIWVLASDGHGLALQEAVGRVRENRRRMERWKTAKTADEALKVAQEILEAEGEGMRIGQPCPPHRGQDAPLHLFLSYSSQNSLLARQIYEDLTIDAHVSVWFDLAQRAATVPAREKQVVAWLRRSVEETRAFLLLLTNEAVASKWVSREISFAKRMRSSHADFRIIVVKTDDIPVPRSVTAADAIIDCNGLWWNGGITEELFAVIYGHQSRREWMAACDPETTPASNGNTIGYDALATEAGVAEHFDWNSTPYDGSGFRRADVKWWLEFRGAQGDTGRVSGGGEFEPIDLGIRPGDRVAFLKFHRRWGSTFKEGRPLWMRSTELKLTPDEVLDRYYEALQINYQFAATEQRFAFDQPDIWQRQTAQVHVRSADGGWRQYTDILWAMLRRGVTAESLVKQVLVPLRRKPRRTGCIGTGGGRG